MTVDARHPRAIRADIRGGKLPGATAGLGQNYERIFRVGPSYALVIPKSLLEICATCLLRVTFLPAKPSF
jgi:hypothetical protein